jgi:hypothetical protein
MNRKRRVVAKKSAGPMSLDKLSRRLPLVKIVNKNCARFPGAEKPQGEFERAEFLWPINENSVAGLEPRGQDLAGITVEQLDVRIWFQLRLGDGRIGWIAIDLDAYDLSLRETACQHESASTPHATRLQDLPRSKRTDCGVKEKHSAWTDASKSELTPHAGDRRAEVGEQISRLPGNRCYVKRSFIAGRVHLVINDGFSAKTTAGNIYEVRPRKDHRGFDLISDALRFGWLWYGESHAISNAENYANFHTRAHRAVTRVCDLAGNVIDTRKHTDEFREG